MHKNTAKNIVASIIPFVLLSIIGLWIAQPTVANYDLEIPIGSEISVSGPGDYIRLVFMFGLGLVGITALGAIVFGGIIYLTSGGNESRAGYGKQWITSAVLGLLLLLCSYLILNTINPDLVSLKNPQLKQIAIPHLGLGYNLTDTQLAALPSVTSAAGEDLIKKYAEQNGLREALVNRLIRVESTNNPNAVSPKGAQGLGQLMPATAREMGVTNPFDPEQNLAGSTKYLNQMMGVVAPYAGGNTTLQEKMAVAAYNAGPERFKNSGGNFASLPSETQQHVIKIFGNGW